MISEVYMAAIFPSHEWLEDLERKLNNDQRYAQIARNWEGEICLPIEAGGPIKESMIFYLDLWHGTCRKAEIISEIGDLEPAFLLTATYENLTKILKGELDPMQAMMTRKLHVQGSMAYMMRNIPTVLDFVRCAREVTTEILS
jgi:putative sterol carrier protein